jgi:hypothetical protein
MRLPFVCSVIHDIASSCNNQGARSYFWLKFGIFCIKVQQMRDFYSFFHFMEVRIPFGKSIPWRKPAPKNLHEKGRPTPPLKPAADQSSAA